MCSFKNKLKDKHGERALTLSIYLDFLDLGTYLFSIIRTIRSCPWSRPCCNCRRSL